MNKSIEEIAKLLAIEFSIDYKPWEQGLDYKNYAEYGFIKGFLQGYELAKKNNLINKEQHPNNCKFKINQN